MGNAQTTARFDDAARKGTLPPVPWMVPDEEHSEHPLFAIHTGQAFVTPGRR